MSGYTTTGATVARDVEALSASILLLISFPLDWRDSIIVLSVAILPELAVAGMQLVEAETVDLNLVLAPALQIQRGNFGAYMLE